MAEIFDTTKQNVSYHINNIFNEGELNKFATVKEILTVQEEGKRNVQRNIEFYNLDVIISVGYRISSAKATLFRIWATSILKEYLVKGFALDDDRLKQGKIKLTNIGQQAKDLGGHYKYIDHKESQKKYEENKNKAELESLLSSVKLNKYLYKTR